MTISERAYRAAMLAYPAPYRDERGEEILSTINDGGQSFRLREVGGLLAGGLRIRGARASEGTLRGSSALGCQLAALVIFGLVAAARLNATAWDVWYVRMGMHWPQQIFGAQVFQFGNGYLGGNLAAAALPLVGVAALCRGRVRLAIFASVAMSCAYAIPALSFDHTYRQWGVVNELAVLQASQVGVLLAPAMILWTTRRAATATARHSIGWVALPFIVAAIYLAGLTAVELCFWLLAAVVGVWALIARFDPRYGVAAFVLALVCTLKLLPVALIQSGGTSYVFVITSAACIAAASIRSILDAHTTST